MKNDIAVVFSLIIIIMVGLANRSMAQGLEIDCGDDVLIRNGVDIQFLNVDLNTDHVVTVLGLDEFDPVVAVFNQQQNGDCNDDSTNAAGYFLDLPTTGFVAPNDLNSQLTFSNSLFMRVVVGEFDDLSGEAVIMVEGLTFDGTPDLINVTVTDDMIASGLPLTAYVIETIPDLDLSLAVVDDNGVPLLDDTEQPVECDDAGDNELCWGAHVPLLDSYTNISNTIETSATAISPMLSIPLSANDVGSIVPFQITHSVESEQTLTGEYIFLLHYGVGALNIADGIASSTTSPLGTTLSCDGEIMLNSAIEVTIPRVDSQYTVSALAKDVSNPMLGVMDSAGGGVCYVISPDGDQLFAELPIIESFNRSVNNVYTSIITENARILTGLVNDASGSYLLAVDGLNIPPDGTSDVISVKVTQAMVDSGEPLSAFVIAHTLDLNPQLALVSADQEILVDADSNPIVCSHTTTADACWGDYEDMGIAQIALGEDNLTLGVSGDVMLRIPLSEELVGTSLNFMASRVEETFGDYIFILHVPTGTQE